MRLSGKRIFISAAAQGIGRASALACAAEGARVIATDINVDALKQLSAEHENIETHRLDVRDSAAVAAFAARQDALDGLFNCAGFVHHGSVLDCDESAWDFSMDLNVKSMWRMLRAFLPGMLAEAARPGGSASVLNMASMASSVKGFPNRCVYGVSKAAVIGLTKSVAADFVKQGLRCNALCPGTVDTPSLAVRLNVTADPAAARAALIQRQPLGRMAQAAEIAAVAVMLASAENSFMSGADVVVDGGISL